MSTTALNGLRDYLADTLSPNNMLWLAAQLTEQAAKKKESQKKPYTIEELHARIATSEQQSAEGLFQGIISGILTNNGVGMPLLFIVFCFFILRLGEK